MAERDLSLPTIPEALHAAATADTGRLTFHLDDGPVPMRVSEIAERATRAAGTLIERGVEPGDHVGIMGPNRPEWAVWAFATWLAGATLVPVQIPLRVRDPQAFAERVGKLVRSGGCKLVMADPAALFSIPDGLGVDWAEGDGGRASAQLPPPPEPDTAAVVQFTSGSTGDPRGAVLSHAAVLAQARGLAHLAPRKIDEVMLGWAPLFHDLGLFLYLVTPVLGGATSHILPTERFARDPAEWLRLIAPTHTHMTVGPQSAWSAAFGAAARRGEQLDLSTLDMAWFAAEGIDPTFVDGILALSESVRLAPSAIGATYGLAEAVMGVATTPRGGGIRFHDIDRLVLATEGRAESAEDGDARRVVSCGEAMLDMEIRIAGEEAVCPDDQVGEVQVRGPSLMSGYLGDEGPGPFVDGWLRTGDLGYIHEGELYITGRAKDVLIVLGQNYYPEDFEWAAGRVAGVRDGRCAAFVDPAAERLIVMVEPRGDPDPGALARKVRNAVTDAVGTAPGEVVIVPPGTIEKTTSGKVRRAAMREAYAAGQPEHAGTDGVS